MSNLIQAAIILTSFSARHAVEQLLHAAAHSARIERISEF
jgi:hypothetical protein